MTLNEHRDRYRVAFTDGEYCHYLSINEALHGLGYWRGYAAAGDIVRPEHLRPGPPVMPMFIEVLHERTGEWERVDLGLDFEY